MRRNETHEPNWMKCRRMVDIHDVITCGANCGDDRLRGLGLAASQLLPFPIDVDGRPYNTLAYRASVW